MTISSNIAVRERTEALLALCADEAAGMSPEDAKRFWTLLEYRCAEKAGHVRSDGSEKSPAKMTDEQARLFGKSPMPWGKYGDSPVEDVPVSYLVFVSEQRDDFKEALRRYLRSDRVQAEMQEPEERYRDWVWALSLKRIEGATP